MGAYYLGQVGTDWAFVTLGRFNGSDTTDMLLRNSTGTFEVYDISNNNITNAASLGTVGLNWKVAGFADFNGDGMTDMMLRNSNTGAFEIYNISNNVIINAAASGTVGLDWQLGGFAANPPTAPTGSSDSSTSQLVQAMAGFGGGAAVISNTVPLGAETSQQQFLTTPHA